MSEYKDRYVITGMGLAPPIGNDPESAWQALLGDPRCEFVRNTFFDGYESLPTYVAATVKNFNLAADPAFADRKKDIQSRWNLRQQFILWAGAQALRQAGLISGNSPRINENILDPHRFGIYVGTGIGGANGLAETRALLEEEKAEIQKAIAKGDDEKLAALIGATRINSKVILKSLPGRVAGTPSMEFGAKAFWSGTLRECASGNATIIQAIEAIKLGKALVVLAGGVEGAMTETTTGQFSAARAVNRTQDPNQASMPFNVGRAGLVMGQGAASLVIESMEHAINRGAPILSEVVGYADNADAKDETEPDPINVMRCINTALDMAHLSILNRIKCPGAINSHATSTPAGDQGEMIAISGVFKPRMLSGITANKAATGHMFGGGGSAEAVFSTLMVRDQITPPINNLETPLSEAKGYEHLMSGEEAIGEINYVVNNSFGFGGNNAVTIFAEPA